MREINENEIDKAARGLYEELTKEDAPKDKTFDAAELAFLIAVKQVTEMKQWKKTQKRR